MDINQSALNNKSPSEISNLSEWEKRSKIYGDDIRGVLFRGLPDTFNQHLHAWQLKKILEEIKIKKTGKTSVLDIGCGYGRISLPLLQAIPELKITGIDVSPNYVDLFRKKTGQNAFVSFAEDLGPDAGLFDYILCVTVLMYIDEMKLENTFRKLLGSLKKNGKILLLEPSRSGTNFQNIFGIITLFRKIKKISPTGTGGNSFRYTALRNIISRSGASVIREYRIPATTIFFLPLYVFSRIFPVKGRFLFQLFSKIDNMLKSAKLPSIYVFYVIEKKQP